MIIRCPSCTKRAEHNALDLQSGAGLIHCSSCGHGWLEGRAVEVPAEPMRPVPVILEHSNAPETDIQHLLSASFQAQELFQLRRRRRRTVAAGWLILAAAAFSPAAIALTLPEAVVTAAPAAIGFYDWVGREVNIYGLEIKNLDIQHLYAGGQAVIAIRGEVFNISGRERKIPWLRFGLRSGKGDEVYHWQLDTGARALRAGETKSFVTRIASPPDVTRSVEIRFARADEIGSNVLP